MRRECQSELLRNVNRDAGSNHLRHHARRHHGRFDRYHWHCAPTLKRQTQHKNAGRRLPTRRRNALVACTVGDHDDALLHSVLLGSRVDDALAVACRRLSSPVVTCRNGRRCAFHAIFVGTHTSAAFIASDIDHIYLQISFACFEALAR